MSVFITCVACVTFVELKKKMAYTIHTFILGVFLISQAQPLESSAEPRFRQANKSFDPGNRWSAWEIRQARE